jgi:hypothetical protein
VIAKSPLLAIMQTPYPRAMSALLAATLAVLIDPMRAGAFRDLSTRVPSLNDENKIYRTA